MVSTPPHLYSPVIRNDARRTIGPRAVAAYISTQFHVAPERLMAEGHGMNEPLVSKGYTNALNPPGSSRRAGGKSSPAFCRDLTA